MSNLPSRNISGTRWQLYTHVSFELEGITPISVCSNQAIESLPKMKSAKDIRIRSCIHWVIWNTLFWELTYPQHLQYSTDYIIEYPGMLSLCLESCWTSIHNNLPWWKITHEKPHTSKYILIFPCTKQWTTHLVETLWQWAQELACLFRCRNCSRHFLRGCSNINSLNHLLWLIEFICSIPTCCTWKS